MAVKPLQRSLFPLIERIYDAALDHALWEPVLEEITDFVGGTGAIMYSHDLKLNAVTWATTVRFNPEALTAYAGYYSKNDVRYEPYLRLPAGAVATELDLMPANEFYESETYNDFLKPFDVPHIVASGVLRDPQFVVCSIQGSHKHGPFDHHARRKLELLVPHLQRAVRVGNMLDTYRQRVGYLQQALDGLTVGVVTLDLFGYVAEMNAAAAAIIARGDGLFVHGMRLHALSSDANVALEAATLATARTHGTDTRGIVPISIPRSGRQRGYAIIIHPVPQCHEMAVRGRVAVLAFILDLDDAPSGLGKILRELYGLSNAESAVAELLLGGLSSRRISEIRRTSIETVRHQVKSVLSKCGVNGQSALIRLFTSLNAMGKRYSE